jgi:hypothetical protein
MKNKGVMEIVNVVQWLRIVMINVCLSFNVAIFFYSMYFSFPISKAQLIGDFCVSRRGGKNC